MILSFLFHSYNHCMYTTVEKKFVECLKMSRICEFADFSEFFRIQFYKISPEYSSDGRSN